MVCRVRTTACLANKKNPQRETQGSRQSHSNENGKAWLSDFLRPDNGGVSETIY